LPIKEYKKMSELFADDIYDAINLETCVNQRTSEGGPSPVSVINQIEYTENRLK